MDRRNSPANTPPDASVERSGSERGVKPSPMHTARRVAASLPRLNHELQRASSEAVFRGSRRDIDRPPVASINPYRLTSGVRVLTVFPPPPRGPALGMAGRGGH